MTIILDNNYKTNYFCYQVHINRTSDKEKFILSVPVELIELSANLDAFSGFGHDAYSGINKAHIKRFDISEASIKQFGEVISEIKRLDLIKFEKAGIAIQNNKNLYNLILADLEAKQIPLMDEKLSKSRGFAVSSKVPNAMSKLLRKLCGLDDAIYNPSTITSLDKELANLKEQLKVYQSKVLNSENERLANEASQKKFIILGQIAGKYNMGEDVTPIVVFDNLLKLDKYLALGHALYNNRRDWSNGCSYAKEGISYFVVENSVDSEISNEIWDLVNDWDGDGRCFRGCNYNYDKLFSMANSELLKDYKKMADLFYDEIN